MDIRHYIDWNIHNITVRPAGSPPQGEPPIEVDEEVDEIVVNMTPLPEIVDEEEEETGK